MPRKPKAAAPPAAPEEHVFAGQQTGAIAVTHRTESVPFASLRMAAYNPRTTTDAQTDGICRSILQFGIVDPFIVRDEDRLVVGGHQRAKALLKLIEGRYIDPGTKLPVKFSLPGGEVPAVLVSGLSDKDAKLLNLALNKVGGDWDHDRLADLLSDLSKGSDDFDHLVVSGFSAAEIADYVDIHEDLTGDDGDGSGLGPLPNKQAPKLVLDFTNKELRDAVKAAVAGRTSNEPSGDALARMLNIVAQPKPPKRARRSAA